MTNDILDFETFTPFTQQARFLNSRTKYKLFGGAMAGGKTYTLVDHVIKCCIMWPGSTWVVARYRGKDLRRTTWPVLLQMLPQKLVRSYNKTEGHIVLVNGSDIWATDLEDPNKLKSMNLTGFALDEATDIPTIDCFNMLTTRLRKNIPGVIYFGLLATNPEPGWVKDLFITNPKQDFKYFESLPTDNIYLPEDYVINTAKNLPPALRARYLEGSWDAFDDAIFLPSWIIPSGEDNTHRYATKVTFVDSAISTKQTADETAIVTIGIEYVTGLIHEIETVSGRWTFAQIKENCRAVNARNKPDHFYVESVQAQDWLVQDLSDISAMPYRPDVDKIRKAIAVQGLFEEGRIRTNTKSLQNQALEFPNGTHDDQIDAFISAITILKLLNKDKPSKPEHWVLKHKTKERREFDTTRVYKENT